MLKVHQVTKVYTNDKKAVDSLSFRVNEGEIVGFIGPNGAGKSTTLKMITGIQQVQSGEIHVCGYNVMTSPLEAKKQFSFVPDHAEVFPHVRAIDYLNFIADVYEVEASKRKERIEDLSARFQITEHLTQKISSYSHGMKQKLMIIAALLTEPKLFILDEPHIGLDPHSMKELKDLMRAHCERGGSVLFSSHVLDVVENVVDRVVVIHHGKLLFEGTLDALKKEYRGDGTGRLEDIFLEMTSDGVSEKSGESEKSGKSGESRR